MINTAPANTGRALAALLVSLALHTGFVIEARSAEGSEGRPNVLFIAVDDLRPQLGAYGHDQMHTPHMDRLASEGRLFNRHYVQVPTCGSSRFALLTGRRPSESGAYRNFSFDKLPRERTDRPIAMPQFFRRHGYHTVSLGKVSHQPDGRRRRKTTDLDKAQRGDRPPELPHSWDEVGAPTGQWEYSWRAFFGYAGGKARQRGESPQYESADVPDTGYPDGLLAEAAVEKLAELKERDEPFFFAVGFYKPHLPFAAPQKYWDLYDRDEIGLAPHPEVPKNVEPRIGLHRSGELLDNYSSGVERTGFGNVSPDDARLLRHGYYAATSYVDAQVGRVLDALDQLDLRDDTIVVLWGDHGWHLGDNGVWAKHTLHEKAVRSAFIIRVPGTSNPGQATDGLTETVDVYPTLADLCGLDAPDHLPGASLRPLIEDPNHPGKSGAVSYWKRGQRLGRSLRTDRYRLTRYQRKGETLQVELYDHERDPHESVNIAERRPELTQRLLKRLKEDAPGMRSR